MSWYCCCGGGLTGDCISSAYMPTEPNSPQICLHTNTEELYLAIPRKAYAIDQQEIALTSGPLPCVCAGQSFRYGISAPNAPTIECRYSHYNATGTSSPMAGEDSPWTYVCGDIGSGNFDPGRLWPFSAPYETSDLEAGIEGTSTCYNAPNVSTAKSDANCLGSSHTLFSACGGSRWTTNPTNGARRYETKTQNDMIDNGFSDRGTNVTGGACSAGIQATIDTGETYDWLKNFHNLSYQFTQYYWDTAQAQIFSYQARTASECLLAVFHRERWWDRYFNSLDDEFPTDPPAQCRTPQRVAYACAGVPIFSSEIYGQYYNELNAESPNAPEEIIRRVTLGLAMRPADLRAMEKVGLLTTKNWDQEPIDPAFPLRTAPANGEPIRKQWEYVNNGQVEKGTFYMAARPGGWSLICNGASAGEDNWPQINRNSSTFLPNCETIYANNYFACMSAAPFPNPNESCYFSGLGCRGWTPCGGTIPNNCNPGVAVLKILEQEAWAASCAGILFRYTQYYNKPTQRGASEPWDCQLQNEATLAIVPNGQTSGIGNLDLPALKAELFHRIPFQVSRAVRTSGSGTTLADLCCGGEGIFRCGANDLCPATNPVTGNC